MVDKADIPDLLDRSERVVEVTDIDRGIQSDLEGWITRDGKQRLTGGKKKLVEILSKEYIAEREVITIKNLNRAKIVERIVSETTFKTDRLETQLKDKEIELLNEQIKDVIKESKEIYGEDWNTKENVTFTNFKNRVGFERVVKNLGVNIKDIYESGEL